MEHIAGALGGDLGSKFEVTGPVPAPTSMPSRFDLLWGNASDGVDEFVLSSPTASRDSGRSRATSAGSTFMLPPPPATMTKAATFSMPGTKATRDTSAADLLSFSPVLTSVPIDPFFGLDDGIDETSTAAFATGDMFSTTATSPLSTTFSLAPTSQFASFESLHDDGDTLGLPDATRGDTDDKTSPRDPIVEHTTQSFGSLSSTSVLADADNDSCSENEAHLLVNRTACATLEVAPPSRAPPSSQWFGTTTDEIANVVPGTNSLDTADPFAGAGLATPDKAPSDVHFAAWSAAVEVAAEEGEDEDDDSKRISEEDNGDMREPTVDTSDDYIGPASAADGSGKVGLTRSTKTEDSLDACAITTWCEDEEGLDDSLTNRQVTAGIPVVRSPVVAVALYVEEDKQVAGVASDGSEHETSDLRDDISSDVGEDIETDVASRENGGFAYRVEQRSSDVNESPLESRQIGVFLSTGTTADLNTGSASQAATDFDDEAKEGNVVPHRDTCDASPAASVDVSITSEAPVNNAVAGTDKRDGQAQATVAGSDDGFDDFDDFGVAVSPMNTAPSILDASLSGPLTPPVVTHEPPADDEFGDFAVSTSTSIAADIGSVDDGFGHFAQSVELSGDDDCFGDFGDFEQVPASHDDVFTDFQQSSARAFEDIDGDFGDYRSAGDLVTERPAVGNFPRSKADMSTFFKEAFPVEPLRAVLVDEPESPADVKATELAQKSSTLSTGFIREVYRSMWDELFSTLAATGHKLPSPSGSLLASVDSNVDGECVEKKTEHASKYLKYVLSEKIQEASRQSGIFTPGSESHQMHVEIAASGDVERMCVALRELQDALFHSSVNDAMMRIAKQAAISAKAKIAEQAAQQHATSRGGSLFFTTRHLLSRGSGSGGTHGPGSSSSDSKADHAVSDTPTGASVQKLARFSHATGHNDLSIGHRATNREDRVSDGSDHTGHSSGSDTEAASGVENRTRSPTLSNSGSSSGGGLMRKFQDRFSFTSSRYRPRFVSLRRKGQSGEEVRKMELNLDAISGGLDEVKWKCALFLYDVDEVTHVAPSQICIVAYPSKQPLSGKTDRSALTKLVKPGTIWTIDIGANNSDMLNEW
ncbi:unnamed protein product [Hyaloperonospora brassicae]|uniref:ADF-H domain-containing protein n=1 Tax=Hyaloperonospora brassicae TaxID=162125 RepID=A0AAV0UA96_HYABA|nr:unnamed protein product [Hyaloperonospora brassicae]